MNSIQKKPYNEPCLTVLHTVTIHMLAASHPEVHTTSEKASNSYDALTKENRNYNAWDDDWSK